MMFLLANIINILPCKAFEAMTKNAEMTHNIVAFWYSNYHIKYKYMLFDWYRGISFGATSNIFFLYLYISMRQKDTVKRKRYTNTEKEKKRKEMVIYIDIYIYIY